MAMLSDARLEELLRQDVPFGDLTTEALGIASRPGRIEFLARQEMVLACSEEAARLLTLAGATVEQMTASGTRIAGGESFLVANGPAAALHRAWKVAQTLVEYAGGIASRVRRIVEAARTTAPEIVIACTRKNVPGSKDICVRAATAGGAVMHRLGLSETVLVFPEHRTFLTAGDGDWLRRLRKHHPERKVVVEVASIKEALVMARAGADVLQLEKLPPEQVAIVVAETRALPPSPVIIAAGGIDETNAAAYAATGCAVLVTSAPFFSPPRDVKIIISPP